MNLWGTLLSAPLAALLLTGCAQRPVRIQSHEPTFEESNQVLLEHAAHAVDLANAIAKIPTGTTVAVTSIEVPDSPDHPVITLVEDQLMHALVRQGVRVMDRDNEVIYKHLAEKLGDKYSLIQRGMRTGDATVGLSAVVIADEDSLLSLRSSDMFIPFKTQLQPADYLLAYRMLECGILYRNGSEANVVRREGLVRVHVRLENTSSGEVLYADNLSGKAQDEVSRFTIDNLGDYHYPFYTSSLPMILGSPLRSPEIQVVKEITASRSEGGFSRGLLALLGVGALVVISLSLSAI